MTKLNLDDDEKVRLIKMYFGLYYHHFDNFIYYLPDNHPARIRARDIYHGYRYYSVSMMVIEDFEEHFIKQHGLPTRDEFWVYIEQTPEAKSLFFSP